MDGHGLCLSGPGLAIALVDSQLGSLLLPVATLTYAVCDFRFLFAGFQFVAVCRQTLLLSTRDLQWSRLACWEGVALQSTHSHIVLLLDLLP